jgi:hypothetical protein
MANHAGCVDERVREAFGAVAVVLQQVECPALRRYGSDTRQAPQRARELFE